MVLKADSKLAMISIPPVMKWGRKILAASSSLDLIAMARLALHAVRWEGTGVGMKVTVGTVVLTSCPHRGELRSALAMASFHW